MVNNSEWLSRRDAAIPRGVASACDLVVQRGKEAELWDVEGRRYVDFASGIAVLNVGHGHPRVLAAVAEQMEQVWHPAFQVTPYPPYITLAERLNQLAPGDSPKKTLLLTTGAEAVENAVKIARAFTGRPAVIAFDGGFHGRTMFALSLTGKTVPYKAGFGPLPGPVFHAPYPMDYRGVRSEDSLEAIERIFKSDVPASEVAALILEPVVGEGGFYAAPVEFLRALRALCDEHGILLVADEIQTGFGRTGRMFALEHAGIEADLMTVAKSLGGGLPISAVIGRAEVMDAPGPGGLGGTYSGNALACAAALAVLEVIEEEGLLDRSRQIGETIVARLRALAERHAGIGEVRGLGAMCAMELVRDRVDRSPDPEFTQRIQRAARARGLILLACGVHGNVIRILVPLVAGDGLLEEGLNLLAAALDDATESA